MKRIVILGAGTAGTIMAHRLSRLFRGEVAAGSVSITVVDRDNVHVYQPGLLFVPFGVYTPEEIVRPRTRVLPADIDIVTGEIDRVEPEADTVCLVGGPDLRYDVLIVATGSHLNPADTHGLTGSGWFETAFEFYTTQGAVALGDALDEWDGGRLVINVVDMPIKCPAAPLEFAFLADWFFTERQMRDRVQIALVTPLDSAFTKPVAARSLAHLLREKNIDLVTEFNTGAVDGRRRTLISWDEREEPYDLLVTVPLHTGASFVRRSPGLGDDLDFVLTDPSTLQARRRDNIFVIGDATNLPTSKAGSVAHFQSGVLRENVHAFLQGHPLPATFDGHACCIVETGFDQAIFLDFNYDVEPLPGKFPFPHVGPLSLLEESRVNHAGKMAFRWIYWNLMLTGHAIPGVSTDLATAGQVLVQHGHTSDAA